MFIQSLRMTWRDWRAGELRFLLLAIVIAVGALSSVGFFVDRVSNGLQRDANQLLGADLVVSADAPILATLQAKAPELQQLNQARTVSFVSMALSADESQSKLVSVKAVSQQYPLRGQLTLENGAAGRLTPEAGTVWVDQAVLTALQLSLGARLKLAINLLLFDMSFKTNPTVVPLSSILPLALCWPKVI